ncbi:MAG: pitrilysin family protein [Patescibacteria group bacterium]
MKNFKKTILNNGLRIITVPQDGLSATVLVLVEAGSKYETKKINGLSHFLEHMCFKGTARRPSALAISSELDQLGSEYNAFTGQEYTGYYAKVKSDYLETAVDIIADLYSNPVFNIEEIEKEKGVIIEELNMYEDMPPHKAAQLFEELLYGDQPAGWPIGGKKEVIRRLGRDDFIKYRGRHYVAKATAVVVAGAFNEKQVIKQLKNSFTGVPSAKKFGKIKTKESQKTSQATVFNKKSDQTHIVLGCRAFDIFDERKYTLEVLNNILGGGMSSRLFQVVREQLGAAYYIKSHRVTYSDHGYWAAYAGVDHKKISEVLTAILQEMKRLTIEKVSGEELRRAKNHLSGQEVLGLETSDAQAMYYGMQEILQKDILNPKEWLKKFRAVTADNIQKVAQQIFKDKNLNLAVVGPFKDKKLFVKNLHL